MVGNAATVAVPVIAPVAIPLSEFAGLLGTGLSFTSATLYCAAEEWGDCVTGLVLSGGGGLTATVGKRLISAVKPDLSEFATSWYSGDAQFQLIDVFKFFGG